MKAGRCEHEGIGRHLRSGSALGRNRQRTVLRGRGTRKGANTRQVGGGRVPLVYHRGGGVFLEVLVSTPFFYPLHQTIVRCRVEGVTGEGYKRGRRYRKGVGPPHNAPPRPTRVLGRRRRHCIRRREAYRLLTRGHRGRV